MIKIPAFALVEVKYMKLVAVVCMFDATEKAPAAADIKEIAPVPVDKRETEPAADAAMPPPLFSRMGPPAGVANCRDVAPKKPVALAAPSDMEMLPAVPPAVDPALTNTLPEVPPVVDVPPKMETIPAVPAPASPELRSVL